MSPSKVATVDFTKFYNIVDGQQRGSEITHIGIDPTTGEALWGVPVATQQDVDDAVRSAKKAFKSWSQTPIETRQELMLKYADLCDEYKTEMHEVFYAAIAIMSRFTDLVSSY
jgi:acyl-CoA reductase-like NAD-dependent aldehyde dehydrogenase